jgi:hypothetical protein
MQPNCSSSQKGNHSVSDHNIFSLDGQPLPFLAEAGGRVLEMEAVMNVPDRLPLQGCMPTVTVLIANTCLYIYFNFEYKTRADFVVYLSLKSLDLTSLAPVFVKT